MSNDVINHIHEFIGATLCSRKYEITLSCRYDAVFAVTTPSTIGAVGSGIVSTKFIVLKSGCMIYCKARPKMHCILLVIAIPYNYAAL